MRVKKNGNCWLKPEASLKLTKKGTYQWCCQRRPKSNYFAYLQIQKAKLHLVLSTQFSLWNMVMAVSHCEDADTINILPEPYWNKLGQNIFWKNGGESFMLWRWCSSAGTEMRVKIQLKIEQTGEKCTLFLILKIMYISLSSHSCKVSMKYTGVCGCN